MIDQETPKVDDVTQNRDEVAEELTRRLFNFADIAERSMMGRRFGTQFDGDRDLYKTFGYVFNPQYRDYKGLYDRQGISTRIVEKFAKDTWSTPAIIIDGDSRSDKTDGKETPFIKEWNALVKRLRVYQIFKQADIMLGFSRYSVIFLGVPGDFAAPAGNSTLAYLMAYDENASTISSYIKDQKNPKFGMPQNYTISFNTDETGVVVEGGNTVHYTRIIHVAENKLSSRVFGRPRLQNLINRLFDLEKVTGGGAEAVWLSLIKGFILTSKDGAGLPAAGSQEEKQLNESIQKFYNRMQRYAMIENVDVHDLGSASPSVRDTFDVLIEDICGSVGISQRILLGSERGQLASDQDKTEWNSVITERRNDFAEPEVLRPFIDWCIAHKILPAPASKDYSIQWQDVYPMTLTEKADYANKLASGAQTITGGMPEQAFDFNEWRTLAGLQPRTDQEQAKIDQEIAAEEEKKLKAIQDQQAQKTPGAADAPNGKKPAPVAKAKQNTFEGHKGRKKLRGGSLPRDESAGGIANPSEARGIVDKIMAAGKDQNGELGFSYQPFNDTYPTTGVMNSNFPERNENIAVEDFTEQRLIEYVNKNADLLADPNNYLGGWVQYGRIDLDVSRRFETLDAALQSAEENYQAGVFSLDDFKTYYVRDEFDPSSPNFSQAALDKFREGKSVH